MSTEFIQIKDAIDDIASQVQNLPEDLKTKIAGVRNQFNEEWQSWEKVIAPTRGPKYAASMATLNALLLASKLNADDGMGEPQHESTPAAHQFKGKGKAIETPPPMPLVVTDTAANSPTVKTPKPRRIAAAIAAPGTVESSGDDMPIVIDNMTTPTPMRRLKLSAETNPITPKKVKLPDFLTGYTLCDQPCDGCAETNTQCWVLKKGQKGKCSACMENQWECQYEKKGWLPAEYLSSDSGAKEESAPKPKPKPGRKAKAKAGSVQAEGGKSVGAKKATVGKAAPMARIGPSVGGSYDVQMEDQGGVGKKRKLTDGTGVDADSFNKKAATLKTILEGVRKSSKEARDIRRMLQETGAVYAKKIREYETKLESTEESLADALAKLDM